MRPVVYDTRFNYLRMKHYLLLFLLGWRESMMAYVSGADVMACKQSFHPPPHIGYKDYEIDE